MSTAKLVKWGNSVGIRIPAKDLQSANASVGTTFKITANAKGGFILTPIKNPQEGWLEAFNRAADAEKEKLLIDHLENDFDKDGWTW